MRLSACVVVVMCCMACGEDVAVVPGATSGSGGGEGGARPTAGVPDGACGLGFASDGAMGCEPILPAADCAPGRMALPGETRCRPVAPCGSGDWGEIPVDAGTEYVDQSHIGTSDGSLANPWTTIGDALMAASPGAIIAVAQGTYDEDLEIVEPVRIWGRCPELVTVSGQGTLLGAMTIHSANAGGTEVHDIGVTGLDIGIVMYGALDVVLDRVWVHDTAARGVDVEEVGPDTRFALSRSLVEKTHNSGVFTFGVEGRVEQTVVRDTLPDVGTLDFGRGVSIVRMEAPGTRSVVTVTGSWIEGNHNTGVFVSGSDAIIEDTLVRNTQPQASNQRFGRGIALQAEMDGEPSNGVLRRVVVANNHDAGVFVLGSEVRMEHTVVRDTELQQSDQLFGRGVSIQQDPMNVQPSTATLEASLITRHHDVGLFAAGSDVAMSHVLVADILPNGIDSSGRCVAVRFRPETGRPSSLVLDSSILQGCHDVGLHVYNSNALAQSMVVADITPRVSDGGYGDGVVIVSTGGMDAFGVVRGSWIERASRAGLAAFGARAEIGGTALDCNPIQLDFESSEGRDAIIVDLGENKCGCSDEVTVCHAVSSSLAPPEATPL